MTPWRTKADLVISMTLAETFLLLVFLVWYATRPSLAAKPLTSIEILQAENARLTKQLTELRAQLGDLERRLQWWRTRFDQPVPGSEEELRRILFEAGRGKPKCQEDNVLLEIAVINSTTRLKILTNAPALSTTLQGRGMRFVPGTVVTDPREVEVILESVRAFSRDRGKDGDCRFDYRLTYATYEDYHVGRERFEKFFYSAGRRRLVVLDEP